MRRQRRLLAVTLAASLQIVGPAAAQDWPIWPTRPVTMVIAFPAGGDTDIFGRIFAPRLSELLGQPVIVENVVGEGVIRRTCVRSDASDSTVTRVTRDTKLSREIKELYDFTCQGCGLRLVGPGGPYAEAAHVRPLGRPRRSRHSGQSNLPLPEIITFCLMLAPSASQATSPCSHRWETGDSFESHLERGAPRVSPAALRTDFGRDS